MKISSFKLNLEYQTWDILNLTVIHFMSESLQASLIRNKTSIASYQDKINATYQLSLMQSILNKFDFINHVSIKNARKRRTVALYFYEAFWLHEYLNNFPIQKDNVYLLQIVNDIIEQLNKYLNTKNLIDG